MPRDDSARADPGARVIIAQFAGPHGVRGQFKIRSFTDEPADVAAYGPLQTPDGRTLTLRLVREQKPGLFVAEAPEIGSPEACEAFKGAKLSVPRAALPETDEDEFYLDDLVGLTAVTPEGASAGRVKAVVNYGASDLVELSGVPERGTVLVPFTRDAVPRVDLPGGTLTVVLPEDEDDEPDGEAPPG